MITPVQVAANNVSPLLLTGEGRGQLSNLYGTTLTENVIPFWLQNGPDKEHGGFWSALDRDGSVLDSDKSVLVQGRCAWMFATMYNTVEPKAEWLEVAASCLGFMDRHCYDENGKLYFTVTREGKPLRMRRYVFCETFAAIAYAAYAKATGDVQAAQSASRCFANFIRYSFTPGLLPPKVDPETRPQQGLGSFMIGIVTAQELRENLGDIEISGRTCTAWIDHFIESIERYFVKPEFEAVLEVVGPQGELIDHFDGRTLNPGHGIEAAWFIIHEGRLRGNSHFIALGCKMLDWMWRWGWDEEYGGILYYRDVKGLPVQEYWQDMKFWWPHNEAVIAAQLAWIVTGDEKYARWHQVVHDWSFKYFPDPEYPEWYGYLHRDGRISVQLKGNLWKGPFHLPRMLWYCWKTLREYTPDAMDSKML